LTAFHL